MRTLRTLSIPSKPLSLDPGLFQYLDGLERAIQDFAMRVYADISEGTERHQVKSAVPGATAIDEGQIVLVNEATDKIATKVGGTVRTVNLT